MLLHSYYRQFSQHTANTNTFTDSKYFTRIRRFTKGMLRCLKNRRTRTHLPGTFVFLLQKLILLSVAILAEHNPLQTGYLRADTMGRNRFRVSLATARPRSPSTSLSPHGFKRWADSNIQLLNAMMCDIEHWKPPSWSSLTGAFDWRKGRTGAVKVANKLSRRWCDGHGCSPINTRHEGRV